MYRYTSFGFYLEINAFKRKYINVFGLYLLMKEVG